MILIKIVLLLKGLWLKGDNLEYCCDGILIGINWN